MREEILLKRLRAGDTSAMDDLVRLYYPEILRYCKWHAPDAYLAEDAAQETFLKAIKYFGRCGFSGKLRNFLYKIAGNTCIDLYRSKGRDYVPLEEMNTKIICEEPGVDEAEERIYIRELIRKLEPSTQEIVILRFGQELKLREIADIMGMPMRTVQSKLRAALKELKSQLVTDMHSFTKSGHIGAPMKGGESDGKRYGK